MKLPAHVRKLPRMIVACALYRVHRGGRHNCGGIAHGCGRHLRHAIECSLVCFLLCVLLRIVLPLPAMHLGSGVWWRSLSGGYDKVTL